jgi:hypothetical protein
MKYDDLVAKWDNEFGEEFGRWDCISDYQKIVFAYEEGRRSGFLAIAGLASRLSEEETTITA